MVDYKNIFRRFTVVDIITFGYIFITGIFILLFHSSLPGFPIHLLYRLEIAVLILFFALAPLEKAPSWVGFFRHAYPLALLAFFYSETEYLNNVFFPNLDDYLIRAEKLIFGGMPSIQFYLSFPQRWFSEIMNFGYASYFFLIIGICVYLFFKNKDAFHKVLFIILSSFYCYYIIFILFPSAGPQFFLPYPDNAISDEGFFRGLVKFIDSVGEGPTAAFPSSHVGVAVLVLYFSYKWAKPLFWVFLPITIILTVSTVYIKAHYVIDVIGGFISAPVMYGISSFFHKKLKS